MGNLGVDDHVIRNMDPHAHRLNYVGSVVVASLQDDHAGVVDQVHETVRFVDATRPGSGQRMFQRLRLADSIERIVTQDVFDQKVDPLERSPVLALPVEVVLPAAGGLGELAVTHWSSRAR